MTKKLPTDWFDLSEEQFLLWRKIETMFLNFQLYELTGYNLNFYDNYKKVELKDHREKFNVYWVNKLSKIFKRGGSHPVLG